MPQYKTIRESLSKDKYQPVSASRKLSLLLQRSFRYSYRQRCCRFFPTILCELLLPTCVILLLAGTRFGTNKLSEMLNEFNSTALPGSKIPCSQDLNTPPISSNDLFANCFQYDDSDDNLILNLLHPKNISNKTNLIFQPITNDINELVKRTSQRLSAMKCNKINVWSQNPTDEKNNHSLTNSTDYTITIDFSGMPDIKHERNLAYNIIVEASSKLLNNDHVDMSFLSYSHPSFITDRSNSLPISSNTGSALPKFTDVKIFVDSLLIEYQTNHPIQYELERNLMTCTPFRNDFLFMGGLTTYIIIMLDTVFLIPYIILLTSLIREKNAKVKEILKVLGIEPILNNLAQAIRTMIILLILVTLLSVILQLKLLPDAYFNTVSFGIIFIGYLILSLLLISFCIMTAQIFDSSIRAIVATFAIYCLSAIIHGWVMFWPVGIQYVLIFFSPFIAGRSIFQQAVLHDLGNKDVDLFQTIYRHVPVYGLTLIIMLLSCVFYWALSWYLEKIFPGEYGIPLDWNFLFKRDYWHPDASNNRQHSHSSRSKSMTKSDASDAKINSDNTPIVHVDRLVKKFGPDKIAVNNVSFDLYENQITSLLGPNGSGKTTIFNCLIGIYKQTSGTITMENEHGVDYDTRNNMETLRKSIGYCPQHDILFDLLTVEEQLQFYASARGFGKYKQHISNEMIHLVNLESSKDSYCNSLSGGMKRRLSLACAFVGDTKIILLDEPSSGLDPSNRRQLWDWLRTMKEGKTLLLTTHFMEESDALSDRIMIISNGIIKADGTSAKLKEQYGSGYKLVVNKQTGYRTTEIENDLKRYLPQLNVETDIPGGDVVFRTNQLPDNRFVQALRQLEIMKNKNLIRNYGVQNSTMDDVFLKITREVKQRNEPGATSFDIEQIDEQCQHVFDDRQFFQGWFYYLSQLYGLVIKTLLVRYRRWGITLLILLIPIIYRPLSNLISQRQDARDTFKMQSSSLNPQTILYNTDSSVESYFQAAVGSQSNDLTLEKSSENIREMNNHIWQKRKDRPYTYTDTYLAFQVPAPQGNKYKIQTLSSNLISGYEIVSVASDIVYKHALKDTKASIRTTLMYKKTGSSTFQPTMSNAMDLLSTASCFLKLLPMTIIADVIIFYLIFFYTAVFLISERKDSFLSLLNISGLHPVFYWLFNYLFDIITGIIWSCYLLAIYCLFHLIFNGLPNDRSKSADAMSLEFASAWDLRVQFYSLTILIVLPTLPFVYLLTKIFKSDLLGGLAIYFLLVIIHVVNIVIPMIMMIVKNRMIELVMYWIFNIVAPNINAQVIITYILAGKSQYCKLIKSPLGSLLGSPSIFESIGDDTIGYNWLIFILHILIFLSILIISDSGLLKCSCFNSNLSEFDENRLDNDVLAERHRILNLDHLSQNQNATNFTNDDEEQETDHLIVRDLVKRYSGRDVLAVNHLTFGAKRGEAFGLLGYNGAGKTTTFRILVGDETATEGTAYIDGQNIHHRLRSIRHLGYCPQQDCSMDYLTVQDGLYLLARIRGVIFSRIHSVVQTISSLFLLDPFLNNYIHQLSGGTKRRLHAALALIGPPLVAILDEPTTGVDPNARQQMQEIFLNAVKAKLTIILTSHSMDECERVCNRLGIMMNGQLACLGTIQHLKSKFGQGYTIEVKVRPIPGDKNATVIQNVQSFFLSRPQLNVQVKELTYSTGIFQIGKGVPADLFELLEQNKQNLNIETYTISQTTLEQIFLSLGEQKHAAW